jgi:hypothetical protein
MTGAFGRTSVARSAGDTSSTAGVFGTTAGVFRTVVGLAEVGTEPEPLAEPTAALPEHAPSRKLTAMNAATTTWSRRNFKGFVTSVSEYLPAGFDEGTLEVSTACSPLKCSSVQPMAAMAVRKWPSGQGTA